MISISTSLLPPNDNKTKQMTGIISDVELCCLEDISILLGIRPFYILQLYSKVRERSKIKAHETREVIKLPVTDSP